MRISAPKAYYAVRRHLPVRRVAQQTAPGDGETPAAREKHMGDVWCQKTFLLTAVVKKYSDPDICWMGQHG
jgi:hypothetical protein